MTVIKTAMLTPEQKSILKQCLFLKICDLQKSFYADKSISEREYNKEFAKIDELTEVLGIRDAYSYSCL
jgi:hypothetical protein